MNSNDIILVAIIGSFITIVLHTLFFFIFIVQRNRKLKQIKELLRRQVEIQERTYQIISQEIHDNIGQVLSLAKLNLNTADMKQPDAANEIISTTKDLVSRAITDIRDLSKSLNSDIIKEMGLGEAIKRELSLASKTGLYEINFSQEGDSFYDNSQKDLSIFRMFQETLSNIFKHANASKLTVTLEHNPAYFNLTIADNGIGFDQASNINAHLGLGLQNMQNRASLIGCNLKITSSPGKGTIICISSNYGQNSNFNLKAPPTRDRLQSTIL